MHTRILILLSLCAAKAALAGETRLSLSDIPDYTRKNNPSLRAAHWRVDEARGRLLGSGRLANPEVGFELKHSHEFREGAVGVSFDQKFPLTSRLRLEKAISARLVDAAEMEIRDAERQVIAEAQTLAVKMLALEKQRAMRQKQFALAAELSKFAEERSAKGEISPLDAAQAQVDSQRLMLESNKLETERLSLIGQLKPVLGVGAADKLTITGDLPPLQIPVGNPWQRRPDYRLSQVKEDVARQSVDLAKARKWEDVRVGVIAEGERMEDAPNGLSNTGFVGLRLSLPLPFWNKNEGEIAEKTAESKRAGAETKALASNISNEVATAHAEMGANMKLATETRDKLLPMVLEQTQRLEKAYETGQADLLTVLRAREQRLQLEAAVLDATRDFHLARIRYDAATGRHTPISTK